MPQYMPKGQGRKEGEKMEGGREQRDGWEWRKEGRKRHRVEKRKRER